MQQQPRWGSRQPIYIRRSLSPQAAVRRRPRLCLGSSTIRHGVVADLRADAPILMGHPTRRSCAALERAAMQAPNATNRLSWSPSTGCRRPRCPESGCQTLLPKPRTGCGAKQFELSRRAIGLEHRILRCWNAQRQRQQAQLGFVRAQAQQYLDTTQLFLALGGAP